VAVEEMALQEDGWFATVLVEQLERNIKQESLSSSSNWNQNLKIAVEN
jgi:hypothetical protein